MSGRFIRSIVAVFVTGIVLAGCSHGSDEGSSPTRAGTNRPVQVVVANYELLAGTSNRVLFGLILPDNRLLAYGNARVRFTPLNAQGERDGSTSDVVTATYLPLPGSEPGDPSGDPEAIRPSTATGVYEVEGVRFLRPGPWAVEVAARVGGYGTVQGVANLEVLASPVVPGVGTPAPRSDNPVIGDDVPLAQLDSRAQDGAPVPDPSLHRNSIADAVRAGKPAAVVFSTPTFCQSRFCGPVTDMIEDLASDYGRAAAFIHVEVWEDFSASQVSATAAKWLLRDGELNEPWLFLIGRDGTIAARWDNIFIRDEIEQTIEDLLGQVD